MESCQEAFGIDTASAESSFEWFPWQTTRALGPSNSLLVSSDSAKKGFEGSIPAGSLFEATMRVAGTGLPETTYRINGVANQELILERRLAGTAITLSGCADGDTKADLARSKGRDGQQRVGRKPRLRAEGDLVDCIVARPRQLFYSTQIPVCLWFRFRGKKHGLDGRSKKMRNRKVGTFFIDARKLGTVIDRAGYEFTLRTSTAR